MSDDDTEITEAIRAFLREMKEFNTESDRHLQRNFKLEFEYRRKPYTTVLEVERKDDYLVVNNKCIHVGFRFNERGDESEIDTSLSANSEEKKMLLSYFRIRPTN
jgi:hypothetical protein